MENFYNEFEVKREMSKHSLETFSFDKSNNLDFSINKIIFEIKEQTENLYSEMQSLQHMYDNDRDKFNELEEIAQRNSDSLHMQMHNCFLDICYLEDDLFALYEAKIIYASKHLEINIKKLLSAAYDDKSVTKRFTWENFKNYTKNKGISLANVKGYLGVSELSVVSNSLKHSSDYDESISRIKEFNVKGRVQRNLHYSDLERFYDRIEDIPNDFLKNLSGEIYKDLYSFDESKLKSIAEGLALRMDKKTCERMIKILKTLY